MRPQHVQGPEGGRRLKAEELQQEAETTNEEAGIAGAAGHQQRQHQQQEGKGTQKVPWSFHSHMPVTVQVQTGVPDLQVPWTGHRKAKKITQGTCCS